jgi:chromosome partitioning protein
MSDALKTTCMEHLNILPSTIDLLGVEVELVGKEGRENILQNAVNTIRDKYRYIFIDCPPSLGLLTLNALVASDSVIIPVQCEYYALEGLGQLLNTINMVKKQLNEGLDIEGVLMTMFDGRLRLSNQIVEEVRKYFGTKVFRTVVARNVRLSEAPGFGNPIILYDAVSSGTRHYMDLAEEVLARNNHNLATVQDAGRTV